MTSAAQTALAIGGRRLLLAVLMAAGYLRGTMRFVVRPRTRRKTIRRAEVLLRGTSREGQHRRVARRMLAEQGLQWLTVRWFRLARDVPIRGAEHLEAAEAGGQGVILTTTHCGWIQCLTWRLAVGGYPYSAVSGGWIAHSTKPSDVRQMPMVNEGVAHGARHIIAGTGAFDQLSEVISAGHRTGMAIDMPGSLELTFLDKPARLGQATFRISWTHDAPVVPMFIRRRGLRLWVELSPPIRPKDFPTFEAFAQAVTDVLSRGTLEYADQYLPKTVDILWPGGDAQRALPNRATWAAKLGAGA